MLGFRFPGFLNFIFCKVHLGVAYLRCRQYAFPTAALTAHTLHIYYSYLYFVQTNLNRRGIARRAIAANSCHVLRGTRVRKVSNTKRNL